MSSNVHTWLTQHTLATETISRHNTPLSIFDDAELARLQAFCADPSRKDSLLSEWAGAGTEIGNGRGSLVGHCVQRHGTEEWVFSQRDIEMLREWFDDRMEEWLRRLSEGMWSERGAVRCVRLH